MKRSINKFYIAMVNRTLFVLVAFSLFVVVATSNTTTKNYITNMNGVKSIQAYNIINKYDNRSKSLEIRHVSNMAEAKEFGDSMPISFTGQMTAYNPICVGCTGKVACPPRQNVTNGNIYFEDNTYGKIRILAADSSIPCGTIVKVSNVSFSNEEIIGIVLDRGGAIKGNIMDFLVTETDNMNIVGRQKNVHYEIARWGW